MFVANRGGILRGQTATLLKGPRNSFKWGKKRWIVFSKNAHKITKYQKKFYKFWNTIIRS